MTTPGAAFRFWQFSDCHLYSDVQQCLYGNNTEQSLQQVLALALGQTQRADFAVVSGDLVHDESAIPYQRLQRHLLTLDMPVCCIAGNHDDKTLMQQHLPADHVQCPQIFLHQAWQIIFVDAVVAGRESGYLGADECDRLLSCLAAEPQRHTIVCLHHPPLPTGMAWLDKDVTLENPQQLLDIVSRHQQVRAVIWGHVHQEFTANNDGVLWAACPSTTAQFKPNSSHFALDDRPPGFRWFDCYADGRIDTGVVRLPPID